MNETTSRKTNTTNYALIKPSPDDFYNVEDFNSNFDQIDKQLKANATRIEEIYDQTGNLNMAWDSITGKPGTFPPSSHTHTKSQISDFPSSMRANGGNADTVANKSVNDNGYGTNVLWTAAKIASEIANSNSGEGTVPLKHTHYSNDILDLHTVATSGSYTDLSNKPTARDIGAAEMNHGTHVSYATSSKPLSYGGVGSTGISGNVAREDHTHTLPSLPTASAYSSGMMSSADKKKIDSLSTVATSGRYSDLSGIPSLFPPITHTHTKSQISDFPSSLPANGGNADTVDGKHASDFLPSVGGNVHGAIQFQGISALQWNCGQPKLSEIFWNASALTDLGMIHRVNGVDVMVVKSNGANIQKPLYANDGVHVTGVLIAGGMNIAGEINNLKSSVSSGKNAIASAITAKGVSASGSDTHATLANKVSQIRTSAITSSTAVNTNCSSYAKGLVATPVNSTSYSTSASITDMIFIIDHNSVENMVSVTASSDYIVVSEGGTRWRKIAPGESINISVADKSAFVVNPTKSAVKVSASSFKVGYIVK